MGVLMDDAQFKMLEDMFRGFSYGQMQDARSLMSTMLHNEVSIPLFIEFVNEKVLRSVLANAEDPVVRPKPLKTLACPKCDSPMYYRVLRNLKTGYRSNFACDKCGFDHYDSRTVQEVLNEGIGANVTAKS